MGSTCHMYIHIDTDIFQLLFLINTLYVLDMRLEALQDCHLQLSVAVLSKRCLGTPSFSTTPPSDPISTSVKSSLEVKMLTLDLHGSAGKFSSFREPGAFPLVLFDKLFRIRAGPYPFIYTYIYHCRQLNSSENGPTPPYLVKN